MNIDLRTIQVILMIVVIVLLSYAIIILLDIDSLLNMPIDDDIFGISHDENGKENFMDKLRSYATSTTSTTSTTSSLNDKKTYTDDFNRTYPVDVKIKNNKYFGDFYTKWWIPKAHGTYGDWRYSNPYWNPAKFVGKTDGTFIN